MLSQFLVTVLLAAGSPADPALEANSAFAAPVRLKAGEEFMGHGRLYPSPVLFDIDGDQKAEMVIGDLFGKLTVSRREGDAWSAPQPLQNADGKALKFHNW